MHTPRFLLIHSTDPALQLAKRSPFFIQKVFQALAGSPKSVKRLRSRDFLVETASDAHSELLLSTTLFGDVPVSVSPHGSLNSSRGVISEIDLIDCTEEELVSELQSQGVVAARRINFRRDGVLVPSRTVILTFGTPTLPSAIHAGYLRCSVRPYIPNPLRCFQCQVYGHSVRSCRGTAICARCAQPGHIATDCTAPALCVNCKGCHPAFSRDCPKWKEEKEIQRVKTLEGLPYLGSSTSGGTASSLQILCIGCSFLCLTGLTDRYL
ncbi:hypothetical protein JGB54_23085, partial [Salmonella enterica subsp. enterica serovar Agona]|nr:hypothetical protein [Salmonella enterica subsp. enterica serovar Agona]